MINAHLEEGENKGKETTEEADQANGTPASWSKKGELYSYTDIKFISGTIWIWESFFNTIFVSSRIYPENSERTKVIVGSMNMEYISDTAGNLTHNRPKRQPILGSH